MGCNNPTYSNGVNHLIADAPQPSPCDYVSAPLDCTVSDGKAVAVDAAGSGSGTGSGAGGAGNGDAANPAAANGAATGGPTAKASFDPNTGQEVGTGSNSGSPQSIAAEPVMVASRPSEEALLATLTVLEILAAVCAPVLVGAWVQRRRKRG